MNTSWGAGEFLVILDIFRRLLLSGDQREAEENPPAALKRRGNEFFSQRRFTEAERCYREALRLRPTYAEALNNFGCVLKEQGRLEEAEEALHRATLADPTLPEAHKNLGDLFRARRRFAESERSYRQCVKLVPDLADAHNNLGVILNQCGQIDEAERSYRRALDIKPGYAQAVDNLCTLLTECHRTDEAEDVYRNFLASFPDDTEARFLFSIFLLRMGNFAEGWLHHETRYDPRIVEPVAPLPVVPYPQWQGEPLPGRSLLVWYEQGYGDEIQFCRYLPLLKRLGAARITLVCKAPLRRLFESLAGVDALVASENASRLPAHDYWVLPLSIPLHLKTSLETIPKTLPYLAAAPAHVETWKNRLPLKGMRVGLAWKGNGRHNNDINRSIPNLTTLAPLWSVPGVSFVSLQKGAGEDEARQPPVGQPLGALGGDIKDFADCAAIISELDLIICVDTATAHLAGALRKPCWLMLPYVGTDWRWLRERTDSPWYPEVMRIFRQRTPGDWTSVIGEVAAGLAFGQEALRLPGACHHSFLAMDR